MSEIANFVKRIFRVDNRLPEKLYSEAEKKAREAVILFAKADTQASIAQYHANGSNRFDIDKQRKEPATIIRVNNYGQDRQKDILPDFFFVISSDSKGQQYIWQMREDPWNEANLHYPGFEFRSGDKWFQQGTVLSRRSLPEEKSVLVEDFLEEVRVFSSSAGVKTFRIDIMAGGLGERKKDIEKGSVKDVSLVSGMVPQPIVGKKAM